MRKILMSILVVIVAIPVVSFAQESGAFVGSLGLGLTSAQGNFADAKYFAAGSGFGAEAELMFYPIGGLGIGGLINYMRFGSSYQTQAGRVAFNFNQMGGFGKLNAFKLSEGGIYLIGGGGVFTPNAHHYVPDNSFDITGNKSGWFGFGGLGLTSFTNRKTMYELELRYNIARADYKLDNVDSNVFDFVYLQMKLSFASKGKEAPPRY